MENNSEILEDLKTIKKVMEESSRFISLSGLSGIFAGLIALAGAIYAFSFMGWKQLIGHETYISGTPGEMSILKTRLLIVALLVLVLSVSFSVFFAIRKSHKKGLKIWTPVSKRFLVNMLVPLITGGIIILLFYFENYWQFIIPSMLIFYGLALVNASKFTYNEVFYLGIIEIIAGLISAIFPSFSILLWCFGFGVLHLLYGLIMFRKYER